MNSNKFLSFTLILTLIILKTESIDCLNASEIDSFVLLHDRVKNTLIEIAINGRCHSPKPTVVYVSETADKLYLPRATILYRCSDQFGCCPNPKHTCVAIEEEEVDIGFYALTKSEDQIIERVIEVLKFRNHTKCDCRRRKTQTNSESKDILLSSESTKRDFQTKLSPSERNVTKSTIVSSLTTVRIEWPKNESKVTNKTSIPQNAKKESIDDQNNFVDFTLQSLNSTSPKRTTQLIITSTRKPFSPSSDVKTSERSTKTKAIPQEISQTVSKVTNLTPRTRTVKFSQSTDYTKTPEINRFKNLFVTSPKPRQLTTKTTFLSNTNESKSSKTSLPPLKSTIDYSELEREDDLKPEEDVVVNSGNGFNLFYTNSIFFRPLTTTPYRVFRFIEKITKKCGNK